MKQSECLQKRGGEWRAGCVAALWVLCALAGGWAIRAVWQAGGPLLLAPMMTVTNNCLSPARRLPQERVALVQQDCGGKAGSAAKIVESTLSKLGTSISKNRKWELGYTLNIPLLYVFKKTNDGWVVDEEMLNHIVNTIKEVQRPVIVYLFSNHFSTGHPLEDILAGDEENLLSTSVWKMQIDDYLGAPLYPWNFTKTNNGITQYRVKAIDAIVEKICEAGNETVQNKIRGFTLLGETHHLFPDFNSGMAFDAPYAVSDYGADSADGFRRYLKKRFGRIEVLNKFLGENYNGFDEVQAPARDIRTQTLSRYADHIDAYAHGMFPLSGWLHDRAAGVNAKIQIYHNGVFMTEVSANLSRQDVLSALPGLGTAEVGWRHDVDFRFWPLGFHQFDFFYQQQKSAPRIHLGQRVVAVMDRTQKTPEKLPVQALPDAVAASDAVQYSVDSPPDLLSVFYNPLVVLWHDFRQKQVVDYMDYINGRFDGTCLSNIRRYTHQIIPYFNPSWDSNKYAIDASLKKLNGLTMGVSLYGEAAHGDSFFRWKRKSGHDMYAVTEFHPLKAMDADTLQHLLHRYQKSGAQFISFFMDARQYGGKVVLPEGENMFSFDPENKLYGSDVLYNAMQMLMQH